MPSSVSGFSRDLTRHRWINFREKYEVGGKVLRKLEMKGEGVGVQAYPISSKILTTMEYLNRKEEKKKKSSIILSKKNILVLV